ncbi:HNH endonuclease [Pannonibacter indicus]|uniref:HNH endonuclease n=1 Tax=Pannonibacter indicus TaxID=466044 RepID=UPI0035B16AC7
MVSTEMAKVRDIGETRKRSDDMILVGYFLSRCTDFSDGKVPRPPTSLGVDSWNGAYDLFFDALSDGRSQQQFRHTLRNTRDIFDSLFDNGRKGWSDGQKRGSELSERDRAVHEQWIRNSDEDLFRKVREFLVEQGRHQNPDWTRDELIIALDYHLNHRNFDPRPQSEEIGELAQRIAKVGVALGLIERGLLLRTPDAIAMKLRIFSSFDPQYIDNGRKGLTNGNRLEVELWEEFSGRPDEVARVANGILELIGDSDAEILAFDEPEIEASEGLIMTRVHVSRERNSTLVKKKKAVALRQHGCLACEVCGFDFLQTYGERGREFIECHHTLPISSLGEHGKTNLKDLALVCSNCHRMIHARRPWWSIDDAKAALIGANGSRAQS